MTQEFRPGLVEPFEDQEEEDDLWILAIQDEARRRTEYDSLSTVGFGGKKKSMDDDRAQLALSLRGTSGNERAHRTRINALNLEPSAPRLQPQKAEEELRTRKLLSGGPVSVSGGPVSALQRDTLRETSTGSSGPQFLMSTSSGRDQELAASPGLTIAREGELQAVVLEKTRS